MWQGGLELKLLESVPVEFDFVSVGQCDDDSPAYLPILPAFPKSSWVFVVCLLVLWRVAGGGAVSG